jgi:NTP pyrophosphatase (non-canonical NTP hydrolase)
MSRVSPDGRTVIPSPQFSPRLLGDLTLRAVQAESARAWAIHGNRSFLGDGLTTLERLAALIEETGEVGKALVDGEPRDNVVKELLQVAASAASWAEWLDTQPSED